MNVVVFNLLLVVVCGYALWRGGAPERIAAALFAGAAATTFVSMYGYSFRAISGLYLLVDLALFVAIALLSLWADRFWPLWVAALQLMVLAAHGVRATHPELLPFIYYVATAKLAYPMIMMLAIGTVRHRERLARWGSDLDWSRAHDRPAGQHAAAD
jgi:hypothetical protein